LAHLSGDGDWLAHRQSIKIIGLSLLDESIVDTSVSAGRLSLPSESRTPGLVMKAAPAPDLEGLADRPRQPKRPVHPAVDPMATRIVLKV
jgi:hypothetical protein